MVFSVDTLLENQDKIPSTLLEPEVYEEKSTLDEAIAILTEEHEMFDGFFEQYFTEGIGDRLAMFDFSTILSKIFDLFVSALGRLASSFGAFLLNFVNNDAELKIFKNKLANYRGDIRYTKPYYTYTNIAPNTMPALDYKNQIDAAYLNFTNVFTGNYRSPSDLVQALNDRINEVSLGGLESYNLREIRAKLVGHNGDVSSSDYHDYLFRYFRNGQINRTETRTKMFEKNINGERIAVAYKDYYASNKQISSINRESTKYKAEALAAKAKVRMFRPLSVLDKSLFNSEVLVTINKFVSATCKEIQNICDCYILFFAAKIDALKEYNKTNKEILLLACKQMTRESGNND